MPERRLADVEAVRAQLGRAPTTEFTVLARCAARGGHPLVIRNHPVDHEGRPFPTLYWLTCPTAVKAVARLESRGWIAKLSERAHSEPEFFHALALAHAAYALDR